MKPIIKIENLSKLYHLGVVGTGTISRDLNRWWAKVRGKENPYLKIGQVNDREKKGSSDFVWALKDIDLEVMPGEVLGIIGKNGAGKSTLLKILSKVTGPTSGQIGYYGRIGALLEVGTGFHSELTGRENIFLNGAILGMTKQEIRSKLDEIIAFSGCERYIDTPVKRYSSGMMVRLGFSVAAHLEPEILIVDEVLAVGDAEFQNKCIYKMNDISRNEGRTILFVSHNMLAVENICSKTLILNNGKFGYLGDTRIGISKYLYEDLRSYEPNNTKSLILNSLVRLKKFTIDPIEITQFSNFSYSIEIESSDINMISAFSILIYNQRNLRIAIIDLRSKNLIQISSQNKNVILNGIVQEIPLIRGIYKLGVYIESSFCSGDFFDLVSFQVISNSQNEIISYPDDVIGIIQLKTK